MVESVTDSFTKSVDQSRAWAKKALVDVGDALKKSNVTTDAKNAGEAVVKATKDAAAGTKDVAENFINRAGEVITGVGDKSEALGSRLADAAMDWGKNLSVTGVVTGLLGVGLAWLIGGAFGGSFSWIIGLMLAPAMFLAGNKFGKDSIEPWISSLAGDDSKSAPSAGVQLQKARAQQPTAALSPRDTTNFGQQLQDGGYMRPQQHVVYDDGARPPQSCWPDNTRQEVSHQQSGHLWNHEAQPSISNNWGRNFWQGGGQWQVPWFSNNWGGNFWQGGGQWQVPWFSNNWGGNFWQGGGNPINLWQGGSPSGNNWQGGSPSGNSWQGGSPSGNNWAGGGGSVPRWNSGGHSTPPVTNNPPPPPPAPELPLQYIPPTIGSGRGGAPNGGGRPFR